MELEKTTLRFERLVTRGEEQVTIEGEATLPGSMRDAVTVLSVQAQAHLEQAQPGVGEAGVRGRVCFQVLYSQGDLTRVRALETSCNFDHTLVLPEVTPSMRLCVTEAVQETEGIPGSGRMTLRALLLLRAEAFETQERELVSGVKGAEEDGLTGDALQTRMQTVPFCVVQTLGTGRTLAREEFDLPSRLGVGDVLSATATATTGELSGGSGRVGVSGVIEVRVLHRPAENGRSLVTTTHELPFEVAIEADLPENAQPQATAEIVDVMADSVENDRSRTLRVEAEVQVTLRLCSQREQTLLADLYSTRGAVLEPVTEELDIHAFEETAEARESVRIQVMLPKDAAPIDTVLHATALPTITAAAPNGRRLDAEGVMGITLVYLPVDSDIPCAVHTREPFAMTFPVEAVEGVTVHADLIEVSAGPTTSDRAEVRCVLGLRATQHGVQHIRAVTDVTQRPQEKQEQGFVLVWPAAGESRWDTARRLRVAESSLRPAGKNALLAFRR